MNNFIKLLLLITLSLTQVSCRNDKPGGCATSISSSAGDQHVVIGFVEVKKVNGNDQGATTQHHCPVIVYEPASDNSASASTTNALNLHVYGKKDCITESPPLEHALYLTIDTNKLDNQYGASSQQRKQLNNLSQQQITALNHLIESVTERTYIKIPFKPNATTTRPNAQNTHNATKYTIDLLQDVDEKTKDFVKLYYDFIYVKSHPLDEAASTSFHIEPPNQTNSKYNITTPTQTPTITLRPQQEDAGVQINSNNKTYTINIEPNNLTPTIQTTNSYIDLSTLDEPAAPIAATPARNTHTPGNNGNSSWVQIFQAAMGPLGVYLQTQSVDKKTDADKQVALAQIKANSGAENNEITQASAVDIEQLQEKLRQARNKADSEYSRGLNDGKASSSGDTTPASVCN